MQERGQAPLPETALRASSYVDECVALRGPQQGSFVPEGLSSLHLPPWSQALRAWAARASCNSGDWETKI